MKAKNLIKRVTIGILAVVLSTSVVWADDNPGLIQRAKDACKNATYDIPTVTNDIDGWPQGPAIMCDSAVVMEAESGEVLYNNSYNNVKDMRTETFDYQLGGDLQYYLPWGFECSSDLTYFLRTGYGYDSSGRKNLIWNLSLIHI
mgnify:CR=1 FL=1